jgi:hypothetical protein
MCVRQEAARMKRRAFLKSAGVAGGAAALGIPATSLSAKIQQDPFERLARAGLAVGARLSHYSGAHPTAVVELPLGPRAPARREVAGDAWACALRAAPVPGRADAVDLTATFKLVRGSAPEAGVALTLAIAGWSRDCYVLFPGACYAGNRFESRHIAYPPLLTEPADIGPNVPTIVSDIPRLDVGPGPSRIELLARDLATPAVGLHLPAARLGVLVLTDPSTPAGPTGLSVEESDDRRRATLAVAAPGVRARAMVAAGNTRLASRDRGAAFRAGDSVTLRARVHLFDCDDVPGLFARAFEVRKDLTGPTKLRHELPFSAAFEAHQARANRRWVETPGYFAVGDRHDAHATYQVGWCGGLAATLPLIAVGDARSRDRALRNLELVLDGGGQAPSGFFHGVHDGKDWLEDGFDYRHARRWHLVRRSADALTFATKQLMILERQSPSRGPRPDPSWAQAVARCADAFVRLWDRHRQLGQYVNIDTGDIVVGGSTSAALAPAGLALASVQLRKDDYLRVAVAAARQMFDRHVRAGLTSGGPGDALQCPDSQSAAALVESFVTLHDVTRDRAWIERAEMAAHQLATWVISYDARAPAAGPGGVDGTGAVLADAQRQHGSPGYVLASGEALLRLYRATGRLAYLELLRDTARNLAQYLPLAEAADRAAAPARAPLAACARADTSDWLEGAGDVVPATGVYDTCSMLAYAELPGLYVQLDEGRAFALDHVETRVREARADRLVVTVANPTRADAAVRVLAETAAQARQPLEPGTIMMARTLAVPAGASTDLELPRSRST